MRIIFGFCLFGLIFNTAFGFTAQAIWKPSPTAVKQIFNCYDARENNDDCIAKVMQENGASQQAIDFAKLLDGHGFMKSFLDAGVVDLVRTTEFAADHSEGYYLINGKPQIINVDDPKFLDKDLWPGDHSKPTITKLADGGVQFIFTYPIKPCHACKTTGYGKLEFNFANDGTFMGIKRLQ